MTAQDTRGWTRATVAEVAAPEARAIAIGPFGSSLRADLYTDSGFPVLRGQDITEGRLLDESNLVFVPPQVAQSFPACIVTRGDLVFPHRGAIGRVGIIGERDYLMSSSLMKLSCDRTVIEPEYLFYYFRGPGQRELMTRASTVGTPGIGQPLHSLRGIHIEFPSLIKQRGIAEVLGALDDKIAANTRLANTVLDLADATFLAAVSGMGFSSETFADVATATGGGTPSTKINEYWNGEISWATPTDVTALAAPYLLNTSRRITQAGLDACASELHAPGSILMTSRATIGAFAIAQQPTAANQGFIVVNARDADLQWWLFHEMRSRVSEFLSYANGATFLELSRGTFRRLPVRLAKEGVMREFARTAEALHLRARTAMVEVESLASLRDALLPALMSGELRVKDPERLAGDVCR